MADISVASEALREMDSSLASWLKAARKVLHHGNYGQLARLVEKVDDAEQHILTIDGRVEQKHLRMWAAADAD